MSRRTSATTEPASASTPPTSPTQKKNVIQPPHASTPPTSPATWPTKINPMPQCSSSEAAPSTSRVNRPLAMVVRRYGRSTMRMNGTTKKRVRHT